MPLELCNVRLMRFLLAISLLGLGCASHNHQDPPKPGSGTVIGPDGKPDTRDYVGKDALIGLETLRFTSPDEQRRFLAARQCFAQRSASWERYPLRMIGNFITEDSCRGQGANRGCSGGGFTERADVDWAEVSTLHYPPKWPEVFGVLISGGRNRPSGDKGWNVAFSVHSNGKTIVGESAHVDFRRESDYVHIGSGYEWSVAERRFFQEVKEEPWVIFERLRSSPDVLRDEGIKQWRVLEKEVVTALDANDVRKCVYGPYQGNGIPPTCVDKIPLDANEKARELNKIRSSVSRVVELLEKESGAMHAALLELAGPDCF